MMYRTLNSDATPQHDSAWRLGIYRFPRPLVPYQAFWSSRTISGENSAIWFFGSFQATATNLYACVNCYQEGNMWPYFV